MIYEPTKKEKKRKEVGKPHAQWVIEIPKSKTFYTHYILGSKFSSENMKCQVYFTHPSTFSSYENTNVAVVFPLFSLSFSRVHSN